MSVRQPLILAILDGFGLSSATRGNAVYAAKTPVLDTLIANFPFVTLTASGTEVGLSWGEMGNSEVGHLNIGAGRIVVQDVTRIANSIKDGTFGQNSALVAAAQFAKVQQRTLHLIGLASTGGVHGHLDTLIALLELAHHHQVPRVALHLIADGRDAEPTSLRQYLARIDEARLKYGGEYASIMGRYYAMDRDRHWDRTQAAYSVLTGAQADVVSAQTIEESITSAYNQKLTDEFIPPTILSPSRSDLRIQADDPVIFTNHRPDRARQLARALADPDFEEFSRPAPLSQLVTFTEYGVKLGASAVAFATDPVPHSLADALDQAGLRQFHVAETEKYAHVTYFLNGYIEPPFAGERRQLVQSPKVATYDLAPQMSASMVTEALLDGYAAQDFDVAFANYANADMVGHTGNLEATTTAIEMLDSELGRLAQAVLDRGDTLLITADHGNAEQKIHPVTGDIDKEHTTNPVPLLLIHPDFRRKAVLSEAKNTMLGTPPIAILADIAPTILELLGLSKPAEMTGESLLKELRNQ